MLAGYFLLLPNAFQELAKSTMMLLRLRCQSLFPVGNPAISPSAGRSRFSTPWSLSIEEQFYLVFSVMLLATLRWAPRRLEAVIVAAGLLSFAAAIFLIETGRDSAAFYLAVSRFWELLIGAWLALGRLRQPAADTARLCRTLGLLLIAAAVFLIAATHRFRG